MITRFKSDPQTRSRFKDDGCWPQEYFIGTHIDYLTGLKAYLTVNVDLRYKNNRYRHFSEVYAYTYETNSSGFDVDEIEKTVCYLFKAACHQNIFFGRLSCFYWQDTGDADAPFVQRVYYFRRGNQYVSIDKDGKYHEELST